MSPGIEPLLEEATPTIHLASLSHLQHQMAPYSSLPSHSVGDDEYAESKPLVSPDPDSHRSDDEFTLVERTGKRQLSRLQTIGLYVLCGAVTVFALANLAMTLHHRAADSLNNIPVEKLPHPDVEAGLNVRAGDRRPKWEIIDTGGEYGLTEKRECWERKDDGKS
ncbi:hypothetical protein B0H11DRAFT_2200759 [Mycena galericulata]|nr:hypothetical protein B0H11DRAFT_2200759 [Mycena galericulata]